LEVVHLGSDRPRRFGRHPDVGIAHIAEVDAGGGRVIERDFRKRVEEKLAYSSVSSPVRPEQRRDHRRRQLLLAQEDLVPLSPALVNCRSVELAEW
jgi:hypothetical protein